MTKPYLLFDAGGTLVFPDFEFLTQTAASVGIEISQKQLFETHCDLILALDVQTKKRGFLIDPFPNGYTQCLFDDFVENPKIMGAIVEQVEARDQIRPLWASTHPWVAQSLSCLKSAGYQMSVISNSDGRVEQILTDLNLRNFFMQVFDSAILGVSKPDVRIFEIALAELNLAPKEAIYIGDVFSIDVLGANQAGLTAIQLDPLGLYKDWPGYRIPTIAHLENWLQIFTDDSFDTL